MRLRTLPKQMGTTSAKAGLRSITADDQELLPANASLFDCGRWPLRQNPAPLKRRRYPEMAWPVHV